MIVDAHTHVWVIDPQRYPWQPVGGYIPEREASDTRLLDTLDFAGVDRAVLVQPTPYGWDNTYVLDAARRHRDRLSVVCLVDPHSSTAVADLERLVEDEGACGVRMNWNLEPEHSWANDPLQSELWHAVERLGVPICVQLTWKQVSLLSMLALNHPVSRVVIDHLARPPVGCSPGHPAFQGYLALAERPNVYTKLSGLYYYSAQQAPYKDTWPLLQAAEAAFGPQRCLWGSDFPFVEERWSYVRQLDVFRKKLGFADQDLEWIMGRTAAALGW